MFQLKIKVEFLDGSETEITTIPLDIVKWEREYNKPASALGNEPHIEWMMFIAYAAVKRRDGFSQTFDEWLVNVATVETMGEEDTPPLARRRRTG